MVLSAILKTGKMKAYNLTVVGKVQGVWFRVSTRKKAEELKIKGFVQNLPDSRVFIKAEGDDNAMIEFIHWCRQGPKHARVDKLIIEDTDVQEYEQFRIKY